MSLFSNAPKSLCVLRLSAIGDVCHAITVVQAIQRDRLLAELNIDELGISEVLR